MHKAFISDKPLIFENVYEKVSNPFEYSVFSDAEFNTESILNKIADPKVNGIIYLCARPDQVWNDFVSRYTLVEAAGGVVENSKGELLVIFRRKKWDLPKGKLDYDESPEAAALREVMEECGIQNLVMGKFLLKTFHIYIEKNKNILKKTHWYSMTNDDDEKLIPQYEEDIEEAKWMSKEKIITKVFANTYASIKEVLEYYFEKV